MACFRDYERCVCDEANDFIDNLDCAAELAGCVRDVVFGGGGKGGGGGGGNGGGGGGGNGGGGSGSDGGSNALIAFPSLTAMAVPSTNGPTPYPVTDFIMAMLLIDRELKPVIRAAHAAKMNQIQAR